MAVSLPSIRNESVSDLGHSVSFSKIPEDVFSIIFKRLSFLDICALRGTSRLFRTAVNSNIFSLNLSRLENINRVGKIIKETFPNLQSIMFPHNVTDDDLRAMVTRKTTGLNLGWCCNKITYNCLFEMSQQCSLEEIVLPWGYYSSAMSFEFILQNRGLKKLVYMGFLGLTDQILKLMGMHLTELTELRLSERDYGQFTDEGVESLLKGCKKIKALEIHGTALTKKTLITIANLCPELEELCCHTFADAELQILFNKCPNLTALNLIAKRDDEPRMVVYLANATWIKLMQSCRKLVKLTINFEMAISPKALSAIGMMSNLRVVHYKGKREGLIDFIQHLPNVEYLDIWEERKVDDSVLFAIGQHCHELNILLFKGLEISDEGLRALAKGCTSLREIYYGSRENIYSCGRCYEEGKLTDLSLKELGENCTQLEVAAFGNCPFTDEGVIYLVERCPSLINLDINGSRISRKTLRAISELCPRLLSLDCSFCGNITADDIEELHLALPGLKIKTTAFRDIITITSDTVIRKECSLQ